MRNEKPRNSNVFLLTTHRITSKEYMKHLLNWHYRTTLPCLAPYYRPGEQVANHSDSTYAQPNARHPFGSQYACVSEGCDQKFTRKLEWIKHQESDHGTIWECFCAPHERFRRWASYMEHRRRDGCEEGCRQWRESLRRGVHPREVQIRRLQEEAVHRLWERELNCLISLYSPFSSAAFDNAGLQTMVSSPPRKLVTFLSRRQHLHPNLMAPMPLVTSPSKSIRFRIKILPTFIPILSAMSVLFLASGLQVQGLKGLSRRRLALHSTEIPPRSRPKYGGAR